MWQVESPTLARTKKMNISKKMCFLLPGNERKKASKIMCHFSVEGFCCRWMQLLPRSLHETFDLLRASIRGISLKIPCLILMYGVIHGYIYMCVFRIPFFLSYTCTCTPPQKRQHTFCQRVLRNIWNRFSKKEPSWFAHWTPRLHTWQEKLDAQYLGAKPFKLGMQSWKFWQHNWHPHDIWKS